MQKDIFETVAGVLIRPTSTLGSICRQRPVGWAIVVYLVACLVSAISNIGLGFAGLPGLSALPMFKALVAILVVSILMFVIFTLICHGIALALGSQGSYGGLFSGLAFASLPTIFSAPLAAASLLLGAVGSLLYYSLGVFGLTIWVMALSIIALKENYLISTMRRAVLILLLSTVALIAISALLIALFLPMEV